MNPFRKKSPADKDLRPEVVGKEAVTQQLPGAARVSTSLTGAGAGAGAGAGGEGGEAAVAHVDFWSDSVPGATTLHPSSLAGAAVGEGAGVVVDIWPDAVPVSNAITSPTSPPRASPPQSLKTAPKGLPPPVAPRRHRSQATRKKPPTPERIATPELPTLADPFNPNAETSSESDAEHLPILSSLQRAPRSISPANPFLRVTDGGVQRSVDMSDLSATPATGRQSLDVDAFKRLMLTGQSTPAQTPQLDSSSTDTSSVSRQSIFEPILEAEAPEIEASETETPRTSHEIDDDDISGRVRPSSNGARTRPKPPPPKPRSRGSSGGKSPVASSATITIPTSPPPPPPGRHASIRPLTQIAPMGPTPPPPPPTLLCPAPQQSPSTSPPVSPAASLRKRTPPSPPLSRRQSVQKPNPRSSAELERPSTPSGGGGKMKPPPPPVRRMKSVSNRPHERSQSLSVTQMQLPPPPPPPPETGRSRSSTMGSSGEVLGTPVETPAWTISEPHGKRADVVVHDEGDILVDLQKLQREVDELRGKYEVRKLDIGVAAE